LLRFEDTIVGQFFGHTHSELLYLTFEDPNNSSSRPTSTIYSAPSLTTYTDFNPAYRIYTIDGERKGTTYKVIDWEGRLFCLAGVISLIKIDFFANLIN
jgi:sphingomyelin phosphodiesterase